VRVQGGDGGKEKRGRRERGTIWGMG